MEDEQGGVVPFEFVKSIGKNICPLNLFGDKQPTASILAGLCRQGPIYVRSTKRLKVWPTDLSGDDEEEVDRRDNVPETMGRGTFFYYYPTMGMCKTFNNL